MKREIVKTLVDGLQWAIDNQIPQHFGDFINCEQVEDYCSMCAVGVIYRYMFSKNPRPTYAEYDKDATEEIEERLSRKYRLASYERSELGLILGQITNMNDDEQAPFAEIAKFISTTYLNEEV